ncbi:hypothetical protein [Nocardia sp. IFM 10818]
MADLTTANLVALHADATGHDVIAARAGHPVAAPVGVAPDPAAVTALDSPPHR